MTLHMSLPELTVQRQNMHCSVSYEVFLEGTDMNVIHMHNSQHHITSLCISPLL